MILLYPVDLTMHALQTTQQFGVIQTTQQFGVIQTTQQFGIYYKD